MKKKKIIYVEDPTYFCNRSFTISYNFNIQAWVSFHSYIPNWFISDNSFFYSGTNSCCDDGEFIAMVGDSQREVTTTSTTTRTPPTTTTTTTLKIDCTLVGTAFSADCSLEGEAIITVPPSTTTTECMRPPFLPEFFLIYGYELPSEPPIPTYGSFEDACMGISILTSTLPNSTILSISLNANSLEIGEYLYLDSDKSNCDYVSDGWYFTDEGLWNGFVYQVQDGRITAINTCGCDTVVSTTTMVDDLSRCCSIVMYTDYSVFYNINNSELNPLQVPLLPPFTPIGIGMTSTKFWTINGDIREWDITLSPFSAFYNRTINLPAGYSPSPGIAAKDNVTIFAVNNVSPQDIVEIDVSSTTAVMSSALVTLPSDIFVTSNLLYAVGSKLIFAGEDTVTSDVHIYQVDLSTITIEEDITVSSSKLIGVYECECNIYFVDEDNKLFVFNRSTSSLIEINGSLSGVTSLTQASTCSNSTLTEEFVNTTTSTTTESPTTTTSTTDVPTTTSTTTSL